jgi:hypothetical protein
MATGTAIATNACNVESPEGTGGTDVTAGACGRGIIVVNSDYQSTNLSLVAIDGTVLSSSFLSSASTASGLSAPLGGDVVTPTQWQRGDEIVLLDRYPASVLTWVDVRSSTPTGQLSLATGFAANPRDYLLLNPTKAYVTRYQPNLAAGTGNHDEGSDIVVVDPLTRAVTTRLSLRSAMQDAPAVYYPYPDKMLRVGNEVAVLLGAYSSDFMSSASSRIVRIDPQDDRILEVVVLDGMHGCTELALSPSEDEIAVSCSGEFAGDSVATVAESGVVLVSAKDEWKERRRFPAAKFGLGPLGSGLAYASDTTVVFTTAGELTEAGDTKREDALLVVDTDSGQFEVALRSSAKPFTFGNVRCASRCAVCFVADASRSAGVVHRYEVNEMGFLGERQEIIVDRTIGLPPRHLGWF